ncbi:recombinase family protein [Amaricoccus solimangrovi]|uniref:Recombinase family protein n=1 Tax=Amaricoccus solimangrovi TaxID=2589815 RepID=A0A501WTG2_9RHOB|nr:recombinase family protein [Amaricoccus solimangrovi]TPE52688.1 recombinase family protein [Amaricoccus solimangrovi]
MAGAEKPRRLRCAIYTRKSTEEGLEQEFNSLDAQREACAAYIRSQKHEGWSALAERYDDGGFSGGSMERPALKALLADVAAGRIDVVVVYKVDRLTRALADFARIVAIFDAGSVSFVSVTQAFNTTTSMGRLTLNVLLSFAQFEREVTAERIRDKIAASKRKGMWMGGQVPFGYRVEARKLVPHREEADQVRAIFEQYLELGTVPRLQVALERSGERTPIRVSASGKRSGGAIFSRGALDALLTNPLLIGHIRHRDEVHPGQHPAIIGPDLWHQVQARLAANRVERRETPIGQAPSALAGRLFDPDGQPMRPSHATTCKRRYRYYVGRALIETAVAAGAKGWRIPAEEVEAAVARAIVARISDPEFTGELLATNSDDPAVTAQRLLALEETRRRLGATGSPEASATLRRIVRRVDVGADRLRASIELGEAEQGTSLAGLEPITIEHPLRLIRRGGELRLLLSGASAGAARPDAALIRMLIRSRLWLTEWRDAEPPVALAAIAAREGVDAGDVSRLTQLAFLAPAAVERILDGSQPVALTATRLKRIGDLPLLWDEQVAALN